MLLCVYRSRLMSFVICAVSAARSLAGTDKQKVVYGELGAAIKLRCILPTGTSFSFIEWRFGISNQLVYFDSTTSSFNTGPKGKFGSRKITGIFLNNGTVHDLSIKRTVSTDEGWYKCRMRDHHKDVHTKIMKLALVSLPPSPPAIAYENGTTASTRDCHNITAIPSVVVSQKTFFLCKVGKSKPASNVSWKRTFAVKEVNSSIDESTERIEVEPLLNFLIECTVRMPSVHSANFTVRHICLRVKNEQEPERTKAILGPTNKGSIVYLFLIAFFIAVIAGLLIVIVLICRRQGSKAQDRKRRNEERDSQLETQLTLHDSAMDNSEVRTEADSKELAEGLPSTPAFHQVKDEAVSKEPGKGLPTTSTFLQVNDEAHSKELEEGLPSTPAFHQVKDEVDSKELGDGLPTTSTFHQVKDESGPQSDTRPRPEADIPDDFKDTTKTGPQSDTQPMSEADIPDHSKDTTEGGPQSDSRPILQADIPDVSKDTVKHIDSEEATEGPLSTPTVHHAQALGTYDARLAKSCLQWIKDTINRKSEREKDKVDFSTVGHEDNFHEVLKDGYYLMRLINVRTPGQRKLSPSKAKMKNVLQQKDLIDQFLRAVKEYGIRDHEIFQTDDLYERQNLQHVVICLQKVRKNWPHGGY